MRRSNCILGCWETIETSFVISNKYKTINPASVKVYLYLVCEVGQAQGVTLTLSDFVMNCGMCESTVSRSLKELSELWLVYIQEQYREDGGRMPSKYWLTRFKHEDFEDE